MYGETFTFPTFVDGCDPPMRDWMGSTPLTLVAEAVGVKSVGVRGEYRCRHSRQFRTADVQTVKKKKKMDR